MNEPTIDGPTPAETLAGGLTVTLTDRGEAFLDVFVRQLPLGEMANLLAAQDNEVKLALLYTGKDAAWFDALTPASQERVVAEGDRVNADFFGRWFRRRLARQERLMPGSTARLLSALEPATANGPSPSLPPPRPVPAG